MSKIIPSGTEGGKEFARIVDLLLFYDAKRNGCTVTLFSDRSGDTFGLDSFDNYGTGYQYKFFSSPLSDDHRKQITYSLKTAIENYESSKITKWVLITPDDLVNSGTRRSGGDVEWFGRLKNEHGAKFEIEHLGHTKLQALFLQAKPLCLHYYPDILPDGLKRREEIRDTRKQYDDNLRRRYSHIEFVGMSVRKEDAARGLPMENIYIPLMVVAEGTGDEDDKALRTNPLALLGPGQRTVILGDPGTGKSTLLHFLALVGISEKLQGRYKAREDNRFALLIILRRYADALKTNRNLPLIDYIVETIKADFSIPSFNSDFILHYLETGRAILLFDGVDELPDLAFKTLVRERVKSIVTSFPGNTAIVTSRIAGYEADARFSGSCAFEHKQMAPLRIDEMRRFATDWHAQRTENEKDRQRYVEELMRILTDPESLAIRQLARNPLLLTIMVLVHRIDAMLPDERVVLYQKCVETLMVSWQARKSDYDYRRPGRDRADQRNLRRLAAIAQWMHEQAGSDGAERRAVVRKRDLISRLQEHITSVESSPNTHDEIEEEAESFLHFVRERAGLLIEAGADLYSFIHLTFQEYLTARNIIILSEAEGDKFIADKLELLASDPRWREVIRLLIAERQSDESKRNLTSKILETAKTASTLSQEAAIAALAGGLLIDRIPAANDRATDVIVLLLVTVARFVDEDASAPSALLAQLAHLMHRAENTGQTWEVAVQKAIEQAGSDQSVRSGIVLGTFTVPLPADRVVPFIKMLQCDAGETAEVADTLLFGNAISTTRAQNTFSHLHEALAYYALFSRAGNFISAIVSGSLSEQNALPTVSIMMRSLFHGLEGFGFEPFREFIMHNVSMHFFPDFFSERSKMRSFTPIEKYLRRDFRRARAQIRISLKMRLVERWDMISNHDSKGSLLINQYSRGKRIKHLDGALDRIRIIDRNRERYRKSTRRHDVWAALSNERPLQDAVIEAVIAPLMLPHVVIWREALRRHFLPNVRQRHSVFRPETLKAIASASTAERTEGLILQQTICWLLANTALNLPMLLPDPYGSILERLVTECDKSDHPILVFVRNLGNSWQRDENAIMETIKMSKDPPKDLQAFFEMVGL